MKGKILILSVLLVSVFTGNSVFGQVDLAEDKVKVTFSVKQDKCEATITAKVVMEEHWHINSVILPQGTFGYATAFNFEKTGSFKTVGGVKEPKPHVYDDEASGEKVSTHEGTVYLKRKIKIDSEKDFTLKGTFDFQTCDETKCLPPASYDFSLKIKGCSEEEETLEEGIEKTFTEVKGDEAKNKEGEVFVKVNDEWHAVPEGNSTAFYKKYLTIVSK